MTEQKKFCCEGLRMHVNNDTILQTGIDVPTHFFIMPAGRDEIIPLYYCPFCGSKLLDVGGAEASGFI